ncbi:MAG TPA: YetF domain-containing protein [Chloroflexota bacterium]|nr:YetF domain-containing protein [Chloroflexota bacterium]
MTGFASILNLDPADLLAIIVRTAVVYVALLFLLRLAGKRELGQMTPFDLVVLLIISNAVQNAMVGPDTSLTGGLVAAIVLVVVNGAVNRLFVRYGWLGRGVLGTPTLLVNDGALIPEHLRREGLAESEVLQALREHGVESVEQVKMAVLEVDGTISVVPADARSSRTRRRVRGRKPAG